MRKLIALLLTFTLLAVSSLPAAAEAATCSAAEHRAALQQEGGLRGAMHAMQQGDSSHAHCVIECGCGCHHSVDALPHLLAPSSLNTGASPLLTGIEQGAAFATAALHPRLAPPTTPPPITI